MKKYLIFLGCLIFMNSCAKKVTERSKLEQRIDSIFKAYKKENYINESVLELYSSTDIDCNNLEEILAKVHHDDQDIRKSGDGDMQVIDSINVVKVISIMRNCKEIVEKPLDRNSYRTIFLVLQHSGDKDLMTFYYDAIKKFVDSGRLDKDAFALYIDRFLMLDDKKQIFGTQIKFGNLYTLENPLNVNKRRELMGFHRTIEEYIDNYGLNFEEEIKSFEK